VALANANDTTVLRLQTLIQDDEDDEDLAAPVKRPPLQVQSESSSKTMFSVQRRPVQVYSVAMANID
jgi:hypothetical protein